ncbi:MAG: histidine phosphatase family protein [Pirellulales bacterium]
MLQFILIRAGLTEFERQGRVQGTLDIPLCEDGRREVAAMVAELRTKTIVALYSGPGQSAEQTAEALSAALELKTKSLDQLQNLDYGLWQGMLISDVKAKQPKVYRQWQEQPETVCPPQGETIVAAKQRAQAVIAKLVKKHKSGGVVALVAPEPLTSIFRHTLRGDDFGDLWQSPDGTAIWELIEVPETAVAK